MPTAKTDKGNWEEVWYKESLPMYKEAGVVVTTLDD